MRNLRHCLKRHRCCSSEILSRRVLFRRNKNDTLSYVTFSTESMLLMKRKCQNQFIAVRRAQLSPDKQPSRTCHFHPSTQKRSGYRTNMRAWNSPLEVPQSSSSSTLSETLVKTFFR
ncbi:hypothetical protein AVEN_159465-1 [Araneus ventricosus]|uniref:Uncharacterized protein n=1 Tax=Araneus ventricosus TaxID=182803 RepID=A0A4Y2A1P8_ARAVE|nr:hypothetical protein AVEN_159465-1 [Araneus ventricosus]